MYADDIQIDIEVGPTIPGDSACAHFKFTRCVYDIKQWIIKNKIKLNPDKAEFSSHVHLTTRAVLTLVLRRGGCGNPPCDFWQTTSVAQTAICNLY